MNTFLKTFFLCLVLSLAFLGYKLLGHDSYNNDLSVSNNSLVFGLHPEKKVQQETSKDITSSQTPVSDKKFEHVCYFFAPSGKLIKATRELSFAPSVEHSIALLLKGPYIAETKKGIYSEIPNGVDLIDIKRNGQSLIVNLSSNFGNGGGTQSVNNRVSQLSKTIKHLEPNSNIYLHIEGKEVEYLGGDGVYIKQPLD